MESYKNLFKEKTESELILLYKQLLDFEESGVFVNESELQNIRNEYSKWFDAGAVNMVQFDLLHAITDKWYADHKPEEDNLMCQADFIAALQDNYGEALARGFDSIVLVVDTDIGNTYYIYDTPDGFQCDLLDYYFDDLEDIASQLYDEIHGNVADIRIE